MPGPGNDREELGDRQVARRSPAENEALVLALVEGAGRPVSAYAIAGLAQQAGVNLAANQVYRTIARLIAKRHMRRIDALHAFAPWQNDADVCLICETCHDARLVVDPDVGQSLASAAARLGFRISGAAELLARCPACASRRA